MYADQILKPEKPLIAWYFFCRKLNLPQLTDHFYSSLLAIYRYIGKWPLFGCKKHHHPQPSDYSYGANTAELHQHQTATLSIEISSEKVGKLLASHSLCAEDIRCLDAGSKQCLKKLCLKACLYPRSAQADFTDTGSYPSNDLSTQELR